jgi:hypothetical protein
MALHAVSKIKMSAAISFLEGCLPILLFEIMGSSRGGVMNTKSSLRRLYRSGQDGSTSLPRINQEVRHGFWRYHIQASIHLLADFFVVCREPGMVLRTKTISRKGAKSPSPQNIRPQSGERLHPYPTLPLVSCEAAVYKCSGEGSGLEGKSAAGRGSQRTVE